MRGTDWLRRKAAARKPASGEIVNVGYPVTLEPGRMHTLPVVIDNREGSYTSPRGAAFFPGEQDLAEQQRTKAAADRASYCQQRGWLDCNCVVIYSRCYYGH